MAETSQEELNKMQIQYTEEKAYTRRGPKTVFMGGMSIRTVALPALQNPDAFVRRH